MRLLTNKQAINIDGLELPINTRKGGKSFNCYVEPLHRFKREIDAMLSHHGKVFVLRFDIHVHTHSQTNEVITRFLRSYAERVKRYYRTKDFGYVWCREVEKAKKQHYHLAVMINGNDTNVAGTLQDIANEVASIQDLTIWTPESPSYLIRRKALSDGDFSVYNEAFYRLSYLAKERGKTIKAERANSYQTSRIKPRLNERGEVFSYKDDYKPCLKRKPKAKRNKPNDKSIIGQIPPKQAPTDKPAHLMTNDKKQLPLF